MVHLGNLLNSRDHHAVPLQVDICRNRPNLRCNLQAFDNLVEQHLADGLDRVRGSLIQKFFDILEVLDHLIRSVVGINDLGERQCGARQDLRRPKLGRRMDFRHDELENRCCRKRVMNVVHPNRVDDLDDDLPCFLVN